MRRRVSLGATAMVGYACVVLLLAAGMLFTIRRFGAASAAQVARVRADEDEITLVERLRWNGELIVSAGRGHLITGHPELLEKLRAAELEFDLSLRALGRSRSARPLVADVERAAARFTSKQSDLILEREHDADAHRLARRFEEELLPLRAELARALDRLVEERRATIEIAYAQGAASRGRLMTHLSLLLGGLLLVGLAVGAWFARRLGRSYQEEEAAHEAARRAVAARDELMAIVAHDLRNPLGAIALKAGLLRALADSDKLRSHAESIENVTLRMESLIRGMLDVTTIEAGRFTVTPAPCALDGVLHDTLELFEGLAASKHVELEADAAERGLVLHAERERVLQLLSNLLGNALKFTPPGGRVTLTVEREGRAARFAVEDTGPGIRAEVAPRIFDRFWKDEASGKPGTGLGLFIAKGIVEAHHGLIWIERARGGGARFCFTLPLAERAPAADCAPQLVPAAGDAAQR
jgi:signal transduction histidine kinase